MNYYLFKLRFLTPLRAGDSEDARGLERAASTVGGDTLFSALCQEALTAGGQAALDRLAGWAREDRLRLSDLLPFCGEDLLVPRPVLPRPALARSAPPREDREGGDRKRMKKLSYLPLTALADYLAALRGEGEMDPDGWQREVGETVLRTQVFVSGPEDPMPYTVGAFRFYGDAPGDPACGLYGVAGCDPAEAELPAFLSRLLRGLGVSGIGGKRGVGCGRFEVAEEVLLRPEAPDPCQALLLRLLEAEGAPGQLLLTTSLPAGEELAAAMEGAWYQLRRRGGFINSRDYSPRPVKRRTQYFFAPGSVFARRYRGELADLSRGGGHPVYRCSRPLFLGVTP